MLGRIVLVIFGEFDAALSSNRIDGATGLADRTRRNQGNESGDPDPKTSE
jgi:hypothetical protein